MTISAASGGAGPGAVRAADQQLMRSVVQRESRAQQQLAERLVRRVRRIAQTLMSGLIDADDAAQHALIEILRSAHTYRGEQSLERWADHIAGRSVVRFARAVRRRNPQLSSALDDSRAPESNEVANLTGQAPRSLDDYLTTMPAVRREVLFLRHALGHGVEQIAEITQASPSMVRDRLLAARRELRMRPSRDRLMYLDADTSGSERWAAIRDRDALGELLTDKELLELEELERTDPIARSFATEERELSGYLDAASPNRLLVSNLVIERETVERVLSAVRVTSQPLGVRDPDADLASAIDPEGPGWIRSASLGLSGLLALVAVIALVMFEPRSAGPSGHVAGNPQPALAPTVEALTTAHTHQRGGRLRRSGKLLAPGEVVSAGEALSAGDKPGCVVIEPASVVCLAADAEVNIKSLALSNTIVQVIRGRVVATHDSTSGSFELVVGSVHARSQHGVFGLELSDDAQTMRIRVLDGTVAVESPFGKNHPTRMQMAVLRTTDRTSVVESLPEGQAQREWELRAVGALEFRR
jgi:RNA polymerase sigma factor (sigma-70 family)